MDFLIQLIESFAALGVGFNYLIIFLILLISGFGIPIPEDITLVTAGILASQHGFHHMWGLLITCLCGVLVGDSVMYFLGYIFGVKIVRWKFMRKILTYKRLNMIRNNFKDNSIVFLFVARFLPGLRAAIYLFSGITRKVSYFRFIIIDLAAAAISVPIWVFLGYIFGDNLPRLKELVHEIGMNISIAAVVIFIIIILYIKRKIKKKMDEEREAKLQRRLEEHASHNKPKKSLSELDEEDFEAELEATAHSAQATPPTKPKTTPPQSKPTSDSEASK